METKQIENMKQCSISVSRTSKGQYSWDLKIYFDESQEKSSDIITRLKGADDLMKEQFKGTEQKMSNDLIEINLDLIAELRAKGWYGSMEADKMIKAFHENKKQNKLQLKRELINKEQKVIKHMAHKLGLCGCGNELDNPKYIQCARCRKYHCGKYVKVKTNGKRK